MKYAYYGITLLAFVFGITALPGASAISIEDSVLVGDFPRDVGLDSEKLAKGSQLIQQDPIFQIPNVIGAGLFEVGTGIVSGGSIPLAKNAGSQIVKQTVKQSAKLKLVPNTVKGKQSGLSVSQALKKSKLEQSIKQTTTENNKLKPLLAKLTDNTNKKLTRSETLQLKKLGSEGDLSPSQRVKLKMKTNDSFLSEQKNRLKNNL